MAVDLIKATDFCSRCRAICAAQPLDIDPLCTGCKFDLAAQDRILPLATPHELAFLLQEPTDFMDSYAPFADDADPHDLPEAQGLWRF